MKKSLVVGLHSGYWVLYTLLVAFLLALLRIQAGRSVSLLTIFLSPQVGFALFVPNLVAFYCAYLYLFPRFLARKKVASLCVGSLGGAMIAVAVCTPVLLATPPNPLPSVERGGLLGSLIVVALIHMLVAFVMRGFITWYGDIGLKEELRRKTDEVEAALLRSKLDPHFLFNTLNNIDVLITRNPASASLYLNQLCDILRFTLYDTKSDHIPLETELAYLEKYIALQRIRYASPDYVTWKVEGNPAGWTIAPLLLIPYIENAFKHSEGQRKPHTIQASIIIENTQLSFECRNAYQRPQSITQAPSGLGNTLMQRRLALLYPGQHTLTVTDHDGVYAVRLILNRDANALPDY